MEARQQQVAGGATGSLCTALGQAALVMYGLKPVVLVPVVPALATGVAARRGGQVILSMSRRKIMRCSKFDGAVFARRARTGILSVFHHNDICNHDRFLNAHNWKRKILSF